MDSSVDSPMAIEPDATDVGRSALNQISAKSSAPVSENLRMPPSLKLPTSSQVRTPVRSRLRKWVAQPAFILHSLSYRDSSLIAQAYTRDQGLITLLAKGAKRHYSQLRGVLHLFQELQLDYSDRDEIKLLIGAEWVGSVPLIAPARHFSAYYLNELLLRFSPAEEENRAVFDAYHRTLIALAQESRIENSLRRFEYVLLKEGGFIDAVSYCLDQGCRVQADQWYWLDPQNGTSRTDAQHPQALSGQSLLCLESGVFEDFLAPSDAMRMRNSLRALITYHLNGVALNTRKTLLELQL